MTMYVCVDCEQEYGDNHEGICPECGGWVTGTEFDEDDAWEEKRWE